MIVVAAPSGGGKTTLCDCLLEQRPDIVYSVSCTTREPRGRELDGVDYFFVGDQEFERRVADGEFLEHATVHGHRYGTLKRTVADALKGGHSVLMDIDVQGARQIRAALRDDPAQADLKERFVDIFVTAPSVAVLRERLEKRGEDGPAVVERRLAAAEAEMQSADEFAYVVVNSDLATAYAHLHRIVEAEETLTGSA